MADKQGRKTGGRKKGSLNATTRLKKSIGVTNWQTLGEFIETEGAKKAATELKKLKGKDYATAFTSLAEFFKPKRTRTEHTGQLQVNNYNVDLTKDEMKEIAQTLQNDC